MPAKVPRQSFSVKSESNGKTPPVRQKNLDKRSREYVTPNEVRAMRDAAKTVGRHGLRDSLIILMAYRHALRVTEVVDLRWDQIDFDGGKLHVNRLKNGDSSVHFLEGDEVRALRKLRRTYAESSFVFCSERKGPLTSNAVHKIVARSGQLAGLEFPVHPHASTW